MKKLSTQVLIILLVCFHFNQISFAQETYAKVWDKSFGGSTADVLQISRPTKDGGYILGGSSNSPVSGTKTAALRGKQDFWLVKIDATGRKQWDKTFGGSGDDLLQDIQQTTDGGYLLGGTSDSPVSGNKSVSGSGRTDYWVVNIDAAGIKKWDKTYGGSANESLKSIRQTTDGGYILGGNSDSPVSGKTGYSKTSALVGENDYWLVKIDAAGIKKWDRSFGGTSSDYLQDLQQTKDGGYILAGHSFSSENGNKTTNSKGYGDFWIIKTDANGYQQWDHTLGGALDETLAGILLTPDNGYLVAGTSKSNVSSDKTAASKGFEDYWLVKLDAFGDTSWDKTIGGQNNDNLQVITTTLDGGFMLGGTSNSPLSGDKTANANGNSDFWLVKVGANGLKQWDKTIGGNDYDNLSSVQQTSSGAYILAGTSNSAAGMDKTSASAGESDFWVVNMAAGGTDQPPVLNQKVESFTLVNADTELDIQTITAGATLNLATLPTRNLNIRANTSTNSLDSVVFELSGAKALRVIEKNPPYILFGAVGRNYNAWTPALGNYTLAGTTYSTTTDSDTVGTPLVISFAVVDQPVTTNTSPVASAGTDKTITLPTSTVTLNGSGTDAEGPITQYAWSQVSGPATATFSSKTIASPIVTGLIAGTYVFKLIVTDNQNALSAADQVTVKVNTNTTTGLQVVSLTLINADTDKDILTLTSGTVLNLATLPTKNLNIRANTNTVTGGSVVMAMSGRWNITKTESAPYTLFGDEKGTNGTNYGGVALPTGDYTVKSTPYTGTGATGTAGTALTVSFKIINQATSAASYNSAHSNSASEVNHTSKQKIAVSKPATLTSFPNPFQDQTTIQFTFAQEEEYTLEVYNLNGDLVSHLKSAKAAAGETIQTTWQAGQNKNGIYVIKLTTKQAVQHLRIIRGK